MNTKSVERSSYAWNTASGMLFAMQSAILLIVIPRTNGQDDAGVFSIAYAISSLMYYIGEYGVRKYQITDVHERLSFRDYHTHRLITCAMVIICSLLYTGRGLLMGQYSMDKFMVIIIVCCQKAVEAYSDVYFSRYQQMGRLDVAAKTNTFRIVESLIVCIIALVVTHNLVISMLAWLISSIIGLYYSTIIVAHNFGTIEVAFDKRRLLKITRDCLPLFLGNFLLLYVGNAPKYAIDACMNDASQACYNYIFMPVFVIGLLANFIFNPILVNLADEWNRGNVSKFRKIVFRQLAVIGGLTLLAILVAATIGCPILGLMYNTDLSAQKTSLMILMIGGGMLALNNFFTVVVTVTRGQRTLMLGYIAVAVVAKLLSNRFVQAYGLHGAAVLYATLMTMLACAFAVILVICVETRKKLVHPY